MLTFLQFIQEARRNPESNPKTSINRLIRDYVEASPEPAYVSFTDLDKLGNNPQSIHGSTPIGIYAYPAQYVLDHTAGGEAMFNLPYAGDMQFANLFHVTGNMLLIDQMSATDVDQHYQQLADILSQIMKWKLPRAMTQVQKFVAEAPAQAEMKDLPGGLFWHVTMRLAEFLSRKFKARKIVQWNRLFRLMGYDGIHDSGKSIIHKQEPTQSVFFTTSAIRDVKRVVNRYSPEEMKSGRKEGRFRVSTRNIVRQTANTMTDQQVVDAVINGDQNFNSEDLNYLDNRPGIRIGVLKERPRMIEFIDKPTIPEQFVVLRSNPILALDLAKRKVLDNLALEFVIEKGTPHQIRALLNGMTRVIAEYKFKPSIPVMRAMVDYDPHVLRVLAVQKIMLIPRSVIQYAIAQLSPNIPDWLENYARNYKLIQ